MVNLLNLKTETHNKILMLERSKTSIKEELDCGIIDEVGAVGKEKMIDSKITKLKKELLTQVHIKSNGEPRKLEPPKGSRKLWRTFLKGKVPVYGKDEETLINKLFVLYGLSLSSTIFEDIFKDALQDRIETENIKKNTILHLESDYQRFFVKYSNTLPKVDIRNISTKDLKAYTQKFTEDLHPTLDTFKAYKGVLNLIFEYAYREGIIAKNPVESIKNRQYNKNMSAKKHTSEEKLFSEEEIELIKSEIRMRMKRYTRYNGYFINGYAILFSIETGCRVAEICSLKWADIGDVSIWIHSQQVVIRNKNTDNEWEYCPYTKNERLLPPDERTGRYFPLTKKIKALLGELKAKQEELGIESEYVFCHENGDWIKTSAYHSCLRTMCKKLFGEDCDVTNNHAFRMSLNSNVFIPKGIVVTERARLLGHSVQTNLKHYSFAKKGNTQDICDILDA